MGGNCRIGTCIILVSMDISVRRRHYVLFCEGQSWSLRSFCSLNPRACGNFKFPIIIRLLGCRRTPVTISPTKNYWRPLKCIQRRYCYWMLRTQPKTNRRARKGTGVLIVTKYAHKENQLSTYPWSKIWTLKTPLEGNDEENSRQYGSASDTAQVRPSS
jgi:hypothetical protein